MFLLIETVSAVNNIFFECLILHQQGNFFGKIKRRASIINPRKVSSIVIAIHMPINPYGFTRINDKEIRTIQRLNRFNKLGTSVSPLALVHPVETIAAA